MIRLDHADIADDWGNLWGLRVDAWSGRKKVGHASFGFDGRKTLRPQYVEVEKEFRRKGVATQMYEYAEKLTGRKIKKSHDLTDDGKAFWRGNTYPKRFGGWY